MKPLYIMFATRHSASSTENSSEPATRSPAWNIDTGIRVLFSAAIQLHETSEYVGTTRESVISEKAYDLWDVHSSEQFPDAQLACLFEREPEVEVYKPPFESV